MSGMVNLTTEPCKLTSPHLALPPRRLEETITRAVAATLARRAVELAGLLRPLGGGRKGGPQKKEREEGMESRKGKEDVNTGI